MSSPAAKANSPSRTGPSRVVNGRGFLETEQEYGDFILQAEIKTLGAGLNSGIFFRAHREPPKPLQRLRGTGTQPVQGQRPHKARGLRNGGIYRRVPARRVSANDNEWFTLTVAARGAHVSAWVNGDPVTDWIDTRKPNDNPREGLRTKPGRFSLQGHDPTTNLLFRNLRVVELDGR